MGGAGPGQCRRQARHVLLPHWTAASTSTANDRRVDPLLCFACGELAVVCCARTNGRCLSRSLSAPRSICHACIVFVFTASHQVQPRKGAGQLRRHRERFSTPWAAARRRRCFSSLRLPSRSERVCSARPRGYWSRALKHWLCGSPVETASPRWKTTVVQLL